MNQEDVRWSRLRRAATAIVIGLLIQAVSFVWPHPTAFLLFALVGGGFVLLGVALAITAILRPQS